MTIEQKVEDAIEDIRPYLQSDGGDVELISVVDQVVTIKWLGYCASCSKNTMTMTGLTEIIKGLVPEVLEVIEIQ
jgi:Fe-S cluster biogenesis protein NfuA